MGSGTMEAGGQKMDLSSVMGAAMDDMCKVKDCENDAGCLAMSMKMTMDMAGNEAKVDTTYTMCDPGIAGMDVCNAEGGMGDVLKAMGTASDVKCTVKRCMKDECDAAKTGKVVSAGAGGGEGEGDSGASSVAISMALLAGLAVYLM